MNSLVNFFINTFSAFKSMPYLIVFLISLMPILELRGGLLAASLLCTNPLNSFLICIIGNIIPVPFILWFITPLFNKLKKTKLLNFITKLENKALSKKEKLEKLKYVGLFLFVGIPLPGTGAWTGSLLASLLDMDKKKSIIAIFLGIILAGIIMLILSYGILLNTTNFCQ